MCALYLTRELSLSEMQLVAMSHETGVLHVPLLRSASREVRQSAQRCANEVWTICVFVLCAFASLEVHQSAQRCATEVWKICILILLYTNLLHWRCIKALSGVQLKSGIFVY